MIAPRRGLALAALAAAALTAAPALAQEASDEAAREADMFGPSDAKPAGEEPPAGATEEAAREEDLFGAPPEREPTKSPTQETLPEELQRVDEAALLGTLADTEDKLAIGARFFLRREYDALESGEPATFALQSPTLLDVYFDGRPSDRVRAYARGRLSYTPSNVQGAEDAFGRTRPQLSTSLDQLWLKFDAYQRVFFTVGKQRLKWGAGRFWNPSDFLNQQRLDPLAIIDERLGVELVKVHFPIESLGWNFYAIADLQDAANPRNVGGAARAEFLVGETELTTSIAARRNNPLRLALDVSSGLWLFDVRAEAAVIRPMSEGVLGTLEGTFDPADTPPKLPTAKDREGEWLPQLVLGADISLKYSDEDSVVLGGEYFFNSLGYEDASLYPALLAASQIPSLGRVQGFTPLYNGRHYAGAYAMLMSPGSWNDHSFTLSALGNLSDESYLTRVDWRVNVLTFLSLSVFGTYHFGEPGEFRLGFEVPPIPAAPGQPSPLPDGLTVVPPRFELGAALVVNI